MVSTPCLIAACAAVQALGVGGDPEAQAVGLVHHRGQLRVGELERVGIFQLVGAGAGRHHLDEVGSGPYLLADRPPHIVLAVGLAVHVTVETSARRRGRDDLPAGQQPGTAERAVAHRLPGLLRHQPLRPADPDGGDTEAQVVAEFGLQEVSCDAGQRFLSALRHLRDGARGVRVGVGQPGHEDTLTYIQRPGAVGARLAGVGDPADDSVLDQDRRVLAQRRSGAVKEARSGQPDPLLGRGGRRDQCREPVCHVSATFGCER